MKTSLLLISLLIAAPAHAQMWRPVDDITSAVGSRPYKTKVTTAPSTEPFELVASATDIIKAT
jgi:hypothetical protein